MSDKRAPTADQQKILEALAAALRDESKLAIYKADVTYDAATDWVSIPRESYLQLLTQYRGSLDVILCTATEVNGSDVPAALRKLAVDALTTIIAPVQAAIAPVQAAIAEVEALLPLRAVDKPWRKLAEDDIRPCRPWVVPDPGEDGCADKASAVWVKEETCGCGDCDMSIYLCNRHFLKYLESQRPQGMLALTDADLKSVAAALGCAVTSWKAVAEKLAASKTEVVS